MCIRDRLKLIIPVLSTVPETGVRSVPLASYANVVGLIASPRELILNPMNSSPRVVGTESIVPKNTKLTAESSSSSRLKLIVPPVSSVDWAWLAELKIVIVKIAVSAIVNSLRVFIRAFVVV